MNRATLVLATDDLSLYIGRGREGWAKPALEVGAGTVLDLADTVFDERGHCHIVTYGDGTYALDSRDQEIVSYDVSQHRLRTYPGKYRVL